MQNHGTADIADYNGDIIYRAGKDNNGHLLFTLDPELAEKDSENNPVKATRKEIDLRFVINPTGDGSDFNDSNPLADVKGEAIKFKEPIGNIIDGRWMLISKPDDSQYNFKEINNFNPNNSKLGEYVSLDGTTIQSATAESLEGDTLHVNQSLGFLDKEGYYKFRLIGRGISHEHNGDPLAHKLDYGDGKRNSFINGVMTPGGMSTILKADGSGEHFDDGFSLILMNKNVM